jgi:hypothetical protein
MKGMSDHAPFESLIAGRRGAATIGIPDFISRRVLGRLARPLEIDVLLWHVILTYHNLAGEEQASRQASMFNV